uniref:Uncharacterized protein n=1 Tax=Rhizophora mucronata TaxID=61149 RepID=A0A2P2NBK2_RHIMU
MQNPWWVLPINGLQALQLHHEL